MNDDSVTATFPPPGSGELAHDPPLGPRSTGWLPLVIAAVGLAAIATPSLLAIVPSSWFVDKRDCVEYEPRESADDPLVCVSYGEDEPVAYAVVPSAAQPVQPRVTITGAETFPSDGETYFVTITTPKLSMFDWLVVRNNEATALRSEQDLFGDVGREETIQQGQQMMRNAKQTAEFVAFSTAGYEPELVPGEVIIDSMLCETRDDEGTCTQEAPSSDVLDPGDKIVALEGEPVTTVDDLGASLADNQPGDMVSITFERDGVESTEMIELTSSPDDPNRTLIGFVPVDTTTVSLPEGIDVEISTGAIGGPSAGLAFTLALIDELTEGDLTGGRRVGVTGSMSLDGRVGAIGGLPSKASAVMQEDIEYFLVPTAQGEDDIAQARRVVGDRVEIIPVATIDEALAALERIGGDPMVPVTPA